MKINKLSYILLGAVISSAAWSCTEELKYDPTPAYTGNEVYFPLDLPTTLSIPEDASQITVELFRSKAGEELTIALDSKVSDPQGKDVSSFITPPAAVTFGKDDTSVQIPIEIKFDDIQAEVKYNLYLAIKGETETPYGITSCNLVLSYAPWTPYKPYSPSGEFGGGTLSAFGIEDDEIAVYVSESLINPLIRYQFGDVDCPELQPNEEEWTTVVNGYNFTFIRNTENDVVTMEPSPTGDTGSFGEMLWVADAYTWALEHPSQLSVLGLTDASQMYGSSFYDDKTGIFSILMIYYISGRPITYAYEYYYLPGFTEYVLELKKIGNFVTEDGTEQVIISAYRNEELASFSYALRKGSLSNSETADVIKEIIADPSVNAVYDEQTNLAFAIDEDGVYTIVAVGFNKDGEPVTDTKCEFAYESVTTPSEFESIGKAMYTDGFLYPYYDGLGGTSWEVEIEQHKVQPGIIRMVNPYKSGIWDEGISDWDLPGNYYITLNIENPDQIYLYESKLGVELSPQNGPIWVSSEAYDALVVAPEDERLTPEECEEYGLFGKMEDGIITFPGATLLVTFGDQNATAGKWYYTNLDMELIDQNDGKIDPAAQRASSGWFELDLTDIFGGAGVIQKRVKSNKNVSANPKMNAAEFNYQGHAKSSKTISGKELMMYNANHGFQLPR